MPKVFSQIFLCLLRFPPFQANINDLQDNLSYGFSVSILHPFTFIFLFIYYPQHHSLQVLPVSAARDGAVLCSPALLITYPKHCTVRWSDTILSFCHHDSPIVLGRLPWTLALPIQWGQITITSVNGTYNTSRDSTISFSIQWRVELHREKKIEPNTHTPNKLHSACVGQVAERLSSLPDSHPLGSLGGRAVATKSDLHPVSVSSDWRAGRSLKKKNKCFCCVSLSKGVLL